MGKNYDRLSREQKDKVDHALHYDVARFESQKRNKSSRWRNMDLSTFQKERREMWASDSWLPKLDDYLDAMALAHPSGYSAMPPRAPRTYRVTTLVGQYRQAWAKLRELAVNGGIDRPEEVLFGLAAQNEPLWNISRNHFDKRLAKANEIAIEKGLTNSHIYRDNVSPDSESVAGLLALMRQLYKQHHYAAGRGSEPRNPSR